MIGAAVGVVVQRQFADQVEEPRLAAVSAADGSTRPGWPAARQGRHLGFTWPRRYVYGRHRSTRVSFDGANIWLPDNGSNNVNKL